MHPVDILVMTNAPLPIPIERLITTADLFQISSRCVGR